VDIGWLGVWFVEGRARARPAVDGGSVTVVRVTHEDRLARFGVGWLAHLLAVHGVILDVLLQRLGGWEELLEDVGSLVIVFAGRLCGVGLAEDWACLLAGFGSCRVGGR
jgi:putative resolvase